MLEIFVVAASLFGHGNWSCESHYDHVQFNVRETVLMNKVHNADLSYSSDGFIIHVRIDTGQQLLKLRFTERGKVSMDGETFSTHPEAVSVELLADSTGRFTDEHRLGIKGKMMEEAHGFEILKQDNEHMEVRHRESGAITTCIATLP